MGSSISTEQAVENAMVVINELRLRVSTLESSVSLLHKNFMNIQSKHIRNDESLQRLDEYVLNVKLMEEGRSVYSKNKFHTRSSYNT